MAVMDEFKEERQALKTAPQRKKYPIFSIIINGMSSLLFLQLS